MVWSTVEMAAHLGLQVCAEGVETELLRERLAASGCTLAQGWLYSAAVPRAALPSLLRRLESSSSATPTPRPALDAGTYVLAR